MNFLSVIFLTIGLICGAVNGCGLNEYGPNCDCNPGFIRIRPDVCCPPNEFYDSATAECKCLLTFVRDPNTQECVCPANQVVKDPQVGCQCDDGLFPDANGNCCPPFELFDGTQCSCIAPLTRDPSSGVCVCKLNEEYDNGVCQCIPGYVRLPSGLCCGENEQDDNGVCTCLPGFIIDPLSDSCICPEHQEVAINGTCVCANEYSRAPNSLLCCHMYEQEENNQCVCRPGLNRNNVSLECMCPNNEVYRSTRCDCVTTFVRDPVTGVCCGPNEVGNGQGNCVCKPTFTRGPITNKCLCTQYEEIDNGTCVCRSGFIRDASGNCVCPPGEILDDLSCLCNSTLGYVRDPVTHVCGCPPNEILIDGKCDCKLGFIRSNNNSDCRPIHPDTNEVPTECYNLAILPNCTDLIPYREANLTDSIVNFFANIFNIVEHGSGNINGIVVKFYNDIIASMGFTSAELVMKITTFIATVLPSCTYEMAAVSNCSLSNIVMVTDQEIYTLSDHFGNDLVVLPCP